MLAQPTADENAALATSRPPSAWLRSPLAVLVKPSAELCTPLAALLTPTAVLELPLACAFGPVAVLLAPVAAALVPQATAPGLVAVAPSAPAALVQTTWAWARDGAIAAGVARQAASTASEAVFAQARSPPVAPGCREPRPPSSVRFGARTYTFL